MGAYNNLKKLDSLKFTAFQAGYLTEALLREDNDPIYSQIENVADELLYTDDTPVDLQQNNTLLEPYLCDNSAKAWKTRKDFKATSEFCKPQWDGCTVLSVRIQGPESHGDDYLASISDTCRRAQELMCLLLKNTTANYTQIGCIIFDANDSLSFQLMTFDSHADVSKFS